MKRYKKWVTFLLASILLTLASIASVNYYVDSYWSFNHTNIFQDYQRGKRERQQKSNALFFRDQKYSTLIFGSSRTAYMNQATWGKGVYNYAASDMQPSEYIHYLDFAINEAKQPIKKVIIGLDFFGSLKYASPVSSQYESILSVIPQPLYRYKLLLSRDVFEYSIKNIKYYFTKANAKYNRQNVKISKKTSNISHKEYIKRIQGGLKEYLTNRYSNTYDPYYKKTIENLVQKYNNIEFIVFTTPVSKEHFKLIKDQNLYFAYEQWIKDNVSIFKTIHHFMYVNKMTSNAHEYFLDSNHGFNSTYDCLSNEILNRTSSCPKTQMTITERNLQQHLRELRILNKFTN